MTLSPVALFWPILFYLIGSIPTGYLIGQTQGIDIRQHGSGNIGATNVWRVLGRGWGLAAFIGDFLKGAGPLLWLHFWVYPGPQDLAVEGLLVLCAIAAILGHNYTPWLGFKGGKGIATSAGILAALLPWVLLVSFSFWLVLVLITRTVSIGSLAASFVLPFAALFFYPGQWIYFTLALVACILGIWRHRSNMQRLWAGTEPKLGSKT